MHLPGRSSRDETVIRTKMLMISGENWVPRFFEPPPEMAVDELELQGSPLYDLLNSTYEKRNKCLMVLCSFEFRFELHFRLHFPHHQPRV